MGNEATLWKLGKDYPELWLFVALDMCMKTNCWFNRNRLPPFVSTDRPGGGTIRRFALLVGAAALALALAAPAGATAPTTQVFTQDLTFVDTSICGFPLTVHAEGTFKVKTYVDRNGNVMRKILTSQSRFTETLTANGKSLVSNLPFAVIQDFVRGMEMTVGLQAGFQIPGEGPVYHISGRLVLDLETGELISFSGVQRVELAPFCEFFAN